MNKLNKEMQKVYDFCEHQKNTADKNAEVVGDFTAQIMFTQQSTAYWAVQQFIIANFMENEA